MRKEACYYIVKRGAAQVLGVCALEDVKEVEHIVHTGKPVGRGYVRPSGALDRVGDHVPIYPHVSKAAWRHVDARSMHTRRSVFDMIVLLNH